MNQLLLPSAFEDAIDLEDSATEGPSVRRPLRIAAWAIGLFLLAFLLWGALAPLSKAAIAPGVVQVEGRRRVVQHLEGGIITEILVRENQQVRRGQPLVRLDTIQSGGADATARSEYLTLLAEERRLIAELGIAPLDFPAELTASPNPRAAEIVANQRAVYASRQAALADQLQIYRETASQARAVAAGLQAQISAQAQQLAMLRGELEPVRQLVAEQLERRSRQLELERAVTAAEGQLGQLRAQTNGAMRAVAEANARMAAVAGERREDATQKLRDVQLRLAELRERLKATGDINRRRTISAPTNGQVVDLRYTTVGGVVGPGQPVLDIVPAQREFMIVARVRPVDIENVHAGLKTEVKLLPFSGRTVPMLAGTVVAVSSDATTPETGDDPYYQIEVRIDAPEKVADLGAKLVSGMPAEVFVVLGERSLISYLFQPLTDSFRRAFRES